MGRILLVDDAAFMRMRCAKLLKEHGHDVVEAENGADALDKYDEASPDLVLMDITMPVMDGIEALRAIVQKDPEAKVVMLSAMGQRALVLEAVDAGAVDFVVKPFEPDRVLQSVARVVG